MDDIDSLYDQLDAYAATLRNRNKEIAELEAQVVAKTELATLYAASLRNVEGKVEALKRDFPDEVLAAIDQRAAVITDEWAESQPTEPSKMTCDAHFVREVLRLVRIQI